MSSATFASADLGERRYLVATLLIDAWLPRALERDLADAERKAMYWSAIYGPQRTRISEVFVPGARRPPPRMAPASPQPPRARKPAPTPTLDPPPARNTWLAVLDRPIDPAYAKACCDLFLLYVAWRLVERLIGGGA
ncbi:MAG: hypothetical protein ACKOEE_04550 [Tagaea sp.]